MSKSEKLAKAHELINTLSKTLSDLAEVFLSNDGLDETTVETPKKKRRDPNAPKAPASNYFLFTNSIREKIDREHPEATFAEKSKLYGIEWQKLSDEEKKPFTEKAKKEREKYNKELAAYEAEQGIVHPEKKVKTESTPKSSVTKATPAKAAKVTKAAATTKSKAAPAPAKRAVAAPAVAAEQSSSSSDNDDSDEESSDSDSD